MCQQQHQQPRTAAAAAAGAPDLLSCAPPCVLPHAAQVNSLTSFETDIPFDYYSMPFCKPPEGVRRAGNAANLGTVIMGVKLENSQYNFTVMVSAGQTASWHCCSRCEIAEWTYSGGMTRLKAAVGFGVCTSRECMDSLG